MKHLINRRQFLLRQPAFPEVSPTDPFYYDVALRLSSAIISGRLLEGWPEVVLGRLVIGLTGYLQDLLTDAGLWRTFLERHRAMYGRWLPFYATSDDYIPHELNREDVRFLVWYTLAMNFEERRVWNPLDPEIHRAADALYDVLDAVYDDPDAPMPEEYHFWKGLEPGLREEADEVFRFGHWLFMHSYLMTPAYAMTLAELMQDPRLKGGEDLELLRETLENSMMEDPTGPLALYLHEWVYLILEGKMPPEPRKRASGEEGAEEADHKYYSLFVKATGGSPIAFFRTYEELNRFFITALGWGEGENLPALKDASDFVLLVNRKKGMLCAKYVGRMLRFPDNPCYDPDFARAHGIDLLTMRGLCPGDLLQYAMDHGAIPECAFPGSDDTRLVADNADFIARCYLQKYYRGD